jgi:hypothetical protein
MSIRVMNYGCKPPGEGAEHLAATLRLSADYRWKLDEIEKASRERYRDVRRKWAPELAVLEEELQALDDAIDEAGGRRKAPKELKAQRAAVSKSCKPLRDAYKADHAAADAEMKERCGAELERLGRLDARINERMKAAERQSANRQDAKECIRAAALDAAGPRTKERVKAETLAAMLQEDEWPESWRESVTVDCEKVVAKKAARAASGLRHGTYAAAEAAHDRAWKDSKGATPRRYRFDGGGKVGVQVRGEVVMPPDGPFSVTTPDVEISELPEDQWEDPRTGRRHTHTRRRHAYAVVRLRVDSKDQEPTWIALPVVIHRRPVGRLRWAYIVARNVGGRLRYELQLTVEAEQRGVLPAGGMVAINLGWRCHRDGRMRVAYLMDDAGNEREVALSAALRKAIGDRPDELRGYADDNFDVARGVLAHWMREHAELVPDWMREATQHIGKWRAHKKLARVAWRFASENMARSALLWHWHEWKRQRVAAGKLWATHSEIDAWLRARGITDERECMALYLEWWRRQNKHLYQYESGGRQHALRQRREQYRLLARELCDTYSLILIDDSELAELALRPPKGTERSPQQKEAAHNRVVAAGSTLKQAILSAALPGQVLLDKGKGDSQRCTRCGCISKQDYARQIVVSCPCGHAEDQDARNCRNKLQRHSRKAA